MLERGLSYQVIMVKIVLGKKTTNFAKKTVKKRKSSKNIFEFWGDLGYRQGKQI
jgi:hypothetical protein